MTRAEWDALGEREKDAVVAEKVMGFRVVTIKPKWYRLPVQCFYEEDSPLIAYSLDANACNAMMYRNGEDDRDGTAPPLPHYTSDESWDDLREVVDGVMGSDPPRGITGHTFWLERESAGCWVCSFWGERSAEAPTAPEAVCIAALTALGHMDPTGPR